MEKLGVSKDIDGLIKALKYPKWYIRRDAVKWLDKLKVRKTAKLLIQLLKDEDKYVRGSSEDALINMGSSVVELLIEYINDENKKMRYRVASVLGRIGDNRAIEPIKMLLEDDDELVRISARYALKNLNWNPDLKTPQKPTPDQVTKPARQSLKKDRTPKIKIKGKTVEAILPYLKDNDKNVRLKAIKALKKIKDEKVVDLLIQSLKDKDLDIRYEAVMALGKIKNSKALNPLTKLLWDEFLSVQQQVLKALGAIGDAKAVDPIIQALKDKVIYTNGFETIEKIGKSAIKPLIKFIRDDDYWIRHYTAETLEKIGWKPANETEKAHYLIAKDDYKGWEEIVKLGNFALEPLIQSLSYDKFPRFGDIIFPDDRAVALSKLGEIALEPLIKVLKEGNSNTRRYAAEALMLIGDVRALEPLAQALNDENSDVRHEAISAFSHYSDEKVIDVYIKYKVFEHKDPQVRKSAMRDIGWREDYRLVEPLLKALKEERWGIIDAAVHSLAELKEKRAVEPLIQLLKHEDSMIRGYAVEGLGDIGDIRA
ncbi:MAG: HEAT repeat domain-containing protein, partial [Thermoplasmatales archaeon]